MSRESIGLTLEALREANVARQAAWCADQQPDLSFRGNELGGECGEAQNVIKKLERERHGWAGSRDTLEHLAEELADVVICADLCAMTAGVDLAGAVIAKFNATSEKVGLPHRLGVGKPDRIQRKRSVVHEVMDDGAGFWHPCSGCQEGDDGHVSEADYPYDETFRCQPGGGCDECGGLGVRWDNTDYARMAEDTLADASGPAATAAVELAFALYLVSGWLPWGTDWRCEGEAPSVPLCSGSRTEPEEWILCCGHVVSVTTMEDWLARGYVAEGPLSKRGHRRTVVAGPKIDEWLGERWHALIPSDDAGPL